jgi:hypothetical protein
MHDLVYDLRQKVAWVNFFAETCGQTIVMGVRWRIESLSGLHQKCAQHRTRNRTREWIRVWFLVQFHAQFACKPDRDPICHLIPITMAWLHISKLTIEKLTWRTSLAANRTPNRTQVRMHNRTWRRPLMLNHDCFGYIANLSHCAQWVVRGQFAIY